MYTFKSDYRGWGKGYTLKPNEVSPAQIQLMIKRGVLEGGIPDRSTNYTIPQVRAMVPKMKLEEAFAFTKGDDRKTVKSIRDELVRQAK
jgi:hypothetical protein